MTKSLFAAQQQIPASPGNTDSEGVNHTSGQATPSILRTITKLGIEELKSFIQDEDLACKAGYNVSAIRDLISILECDLPKFPGSGVLASQAPSATPESKSEPTGQQLKLHGIKQVSGHNKEWMQKCIARFESVFVHDTTFTGESIRWACELHNLYPTHVNAWGALIVALVRKGLIKFTGVYVTPKDKSSHARQIKQYVRT